MIPTARVKLEARFGFGCELAGAVMTGSEFQILDLDLAIFGSVFDPQVRQLHMPANDFEAILSGDFGLAFCVFA